MEVSNLISNMSFSSMTGSPLMAILQVRQSDSEKTFIIDNTNLFCCMFFSKSFVNVLIIFFLKKKLFQSFLEMFCLSLFLVDLVLLYFVIEIKSLSISERSSALCFLLASFSRIYSFVPLPVLVLGAVDHIYRFQLSTQQPFWCKITWHCTQIFVIYLSALVFSGDSIILPPIALSPLNDSVHFILCSVQCSRTITVYCIILVLAGILISLFFWNDMFSLAKLHISHLSDGGNGTEMAVPSTDCSTVCSKAENNYHTEIGYKLLQTPPRIHCHHKQLLAIVTCFMVHWFAFLLVNVLAMLFSIAFPSYVSVNIVWVLSLNSFFTGAVNCFRSKHMVPYFSDGVCNWDFYLKACQNDVEQLEWTACNSSSILHKELRQQYDV